MPNKKTGFLDDPSGDRYDTVIDKDETETENKPKGGRRMNRNAKILALADFAVARGDYRRGSKNYENYVASLMEVSNEELDARYMIESMHDAERKRTKDAALERERDRHKEWMRENSKVIAVRFMTNGDADILSALAEKNVPQEIRRLIRLGIAADQANKEDTQ